MGPPNKYYHLKGTSRYEHILGVFLLLRHLKASEKNKLPACFMTSPIPLFLIWSTGSSVPAKLKISRTTNIQAISKKL
jgi:hypothetical protein